MDDPCKNLSLEICKNGFSLSDDTDISEIDFNNDIYLPIIDRLIEENNDISTYNFKIEKISTSGTITNLTGSIEIIDKNKFNHIIEERKMKNFKPSKHNKTYVTKFEITGESEMKKKNDNIKYKSDTPNLHMSVEEIDDHFQGDTNLYEVSTNDDREDSNVEKKMNNTKGNLDNN